MIPFSDDELKPVVEKVIDKVRPSIALDGGNITFIGVYNQKVFVQLGGACVGCSSSGNTLKYGVEKQLKIDIHPDMEVVNVPYGMEDKLDQLI